MNPPLGAQLALIDVALEQFLSDLSSFGSINYGVVFMRDAHYKNNAGPIVSRAAKTTKKRLAYFHDNIEGRRVDLAVSTLGNAFRSKRPSLERDKLNPDQTLFDIYLHIKGCEFVVEIAFDRRSGGKVASLARLTSLWQGRRLEFIRLLEPIAEYPTSSMSDDCLLSVPSTPNAFVLMWDIAHSTQHALNDYGELRHFVTSLTSAQDEILETSGAKIICVGGDGQVLALFLPDEIDVLNDRQLRQFGRTNALALINKLKRIFEAINSSYSREFQIKVGLGLGYIETTQHKEQTGPVVWEVNSKMKSLAGNDQSFAVSMTNRVQELFNN